VLDRSIERFARFLVGRAGRPYHPGQVALAVAAGSTLELVLVPAVIVLAGARIDAAVGLPPLLPASLARAAAVGAFLAGLPWLGSAIYWQHRFGRGTPLPLLPPRVFLATGPYRFTRNPMTFGAILWLAGWALLANSPTALAGGVGAFAALVVAYVKLVEERELEARFGEPYRRYRRATPFLLPRRG
jgi:protein-S-isoprenylcysteine O-methyltransferase Ste14